MLPHLETTRGGTGSVVGGARRDVLPGRARRRQPAGAAAVEAHAPQRPRAFRRLPLEDDPRSAPATSRARSPASLPVRRVRRPCCAASVRVSSRRGFTPWLVLGARRRSNAMRPFVPGAVARAPSTAVADAAASRTRRATTRDICGARSAMSAATSLSGGASTNLPFSADHPRDGAARRLAADRDDLPARARAGSSRVARAG